MAKITIQINQNKLKRDLTKHISEKYAIPATKAFVNDNREEIKDLIVSQIKKGRTWNSIEGDFAGSGLHDLQAVLGLANPLSDLEDLEDFLKQNIQVRFLRRKIPGMYVTMNADNIYQGLDNFSYVSPPSGETIKWLEWLLLGNGHVDGYEIIFGSGKKFRRFSRTGRALMKEDEFGEWDISESVDTGPDNNFITEAFEDGKLVNKLNRMFQDSIIPYLRRAQR